MANPEHLQILKQGVEVWNAWREQNENILLPDLREAALYRATLRGVSLRWAILLGADLREADLREADLAKANLGGADLAKANLGEANLGGTNLDGADLSEVLLYETVFGDIDLTAVRGLETCDHFGPSILGHRTLAKSSPLPLAFLRGCGLNDWEIEATKLYDQHLTSSQVTDILYRIHHLRTDPLIQFYSCFISYASKDHAFAERLHGDLQNNGVRCWFAPEDMKMGDRIRDTIDQQIRLREKLLVVLSSASIASPWVEDEVEAALEEERKSPERRTVLVPIKIDDAVEETNLAWARTIKRTRQIGDFTQWDDASAYQKAFPRLLRDLTATARQP